MSAGLLLAAAIVLKGATVHTAAGPAIPNGVVVIDGGAITAVGGPETAIPAGARVVDLAGKHVAPAFFAPASTIGLTEIGAVRATADITEIGEINPEVRPEVALNFDSEAMPVARSNGVLFAAVVPRGSVLPGAASAVSLNAWTREDGCLLCPAAVVLEWPDMRINRAPDARPPARAQEKRRDEAIDRIRSAFRHAAAYRTARTAEGQAGVPVHAADAALAALVPVLDGIVPLVVRADRVPQIEALFRFLDDDVKNAKVRVILLGGDDAPKIAAKLAERKIPVILDGVLELPAHEDQPYDAAYSRAAELVKAGVLVAIGNGNAPAHLRDLPNHAAMAVAFGLDRLEALKSITLNPAKIFGLDARVGSLAPGKDASIAVWTGDPLQVTSNVVALYDKGTALDLSDRHKRLWERYRNRPKPAKK
jgi:imidazolonepropionase-like amidohydrolase